MIKNIVKRGSKAELLFTHCGRRGHNASSCESVGQKLLSLLRKKKHSATQLQDFWRMNSKTKSLLEVTGRSLKNRKKNTAHLFKRKFPVNYRSSSKKHFKFPGNFKAYFAEWINSFALAKTAFSKRSQPLAQFSPPTGCLCSTWHVDWNRTNSQIACSCS